MTNTQTPPSATTIVIPTGAPVTNAVANHAEKPEKFNGQNFKRCRIEADRLLGLRLQEKEREQFTVEERAKF
ncbi:hypothetical protein Tco_0310567, partial [Tanacetum coccineum]